MKVYVLTTGEYSEFSTHGVVTERGVAEAWRALQNIPKLGYYGHDFEEYDLDDPALLHFISTKKAQAQ